jgi:Cu-Zn family superoxide dismutase
VIGVRSLERGVRDSWLVATLIALAALGTSTLAVAVIGGKKFSSNKETEQTTGGAQRGRTAVANLMSEEDAELGGTVTFSQESNRVRIVVKLEGVMTDGPHGLHIHNSGKCYDNESDPVFLKVTSAHFNPTSTSHGCPSSRRHHAGDLGNIDIDIDGTGHLELVTGMLSLNGSNSPIGRPVVLDKGADDCKTQPTGNSDQQLACGVVEAEGGAAEPILH